MKIYKSRNFHLPITFTPYILNGIYSITFAQWKSIKINIFPILCSDLKTFHNSNGVGCAAYFEVAISIIKQTIIV